MSLHKSMGTPLVVVPKKDGSLRLCGDYRLTVNNAIEVDAHPLPKPEEIFATLSGGEKFTKIDLSSAYQQLLLEQQSRELVTINTHKGLYHYTIDTIYTTWIRNSKWACIESQCKISG